jgi:hypothetical protein
VKTCSIPGCSKKYHAQGMCGAHYSRGWRDGSVKNMELTAEKRFWSKVQKGPGCWLWLGRLNSVGYGRVSRNGRLQHAHRFVYELVKGPIPPGLEIDHICRNRACVNPDHLRLATSKQNRENQSIVGRGASGIRGVSWDSARNLWAAQLMHNRRMIHLGRFVTIEEAAEAARQGRLTYFTHNQADKEGISA